MNIQFYGTNRYQLNGGTKTNSNTAAAKSRMLASLETAERTQSKRSVSLAFAPKQNLMLDFSLPEDSKHTQDKRFFSDFFENYYQTQTEAVVDPNAKFQPLDVTDISNIQIKIGSGEITYLSKEEHAAAIEQAKVSFIKQQQSASYSNIYENMVHALKGTAKQGASWSDFEGSATHHLYADQRIEDVAVLYAYFQNRIEQDGGDIAELDRALNDVIGECYRNNLYASTGSTTMSKESYALITSSIYQNVVHAAKDYKDITASGEMNPTDFMFAVRGDGSVPDREPLEGVLTAEDLKLFVALQSSDTVTPSHNNEELFGVSLAMTKIMYQAAGEKASSTGKAFLDNVFQQVMDAKFNYVKSRIDNMNGASFTGGLLYDPLDEQAVMKSMNKMLSSYESGNFQYAVAQNYDSILNTLNVKMQMQYESGNVQGRYAENYIPHGRGPIDTTEYNRFMQFIGQSQYSVSGSLDKIDIRI